MVQKLGISPQGVWQMVSMMKRREGVMPDLFRLAGRSNLGRKTWQNMGSGSLIVAQRQ